MATANSTPITKTTEGGVDYFTTTRAGVEYCAYFMASAGRWFVSSRRLALGRGNVGGGKYYDRVEECKPFAALPTLMTMGAL